MCLLDSPICTQLATAHVKCNGTCAYICTVRYSCHLCIQVYCNVWPGARMDLPPIAHTEAIDCSPHDQLIVHCVHNSPAHMHRYHCSACCAS